MGRAGLGPRDIDYVNAHGTGTPHNDAMEASALAEVFGDALPDLTVSSSKGQLGHTLAAAGAIEAAVTVLAIEAGVLPPTGGLVEPDPAVPLRHVLDRGEPRALRAALSNSFGFGGGDTVLLFEHPEAPRRGGSGRTRSRVVLSAAVCWGEQRVGGGTSSARELPSPLAAAVDPMPDDSLGALDPSRSRRFDRATALLTAGAERVLHASGLAAADVGLVSGMAFGNVERAVGFLRRLVERGPRFVSPAEFPHLLPSAPSGNASVYLGLSGPVLSVCDLEFEAEGALCLARELIELGLVDAMAAGSVALFDEVVTETLGPLCAADGVERRGAGAGFVMVESESSARRRGASQLALVAGIAHGSRTDSRVLSRIPPPRSPRRSLVLVSGDTRGIGSVLAGSEWGEVERRDLVGPVVDHDAAGAMALAAGVRSIFDSVAEELLVCRIGRERLMATLLRSVPEGPE
jgi:3-oxoacyl-[acyl-carrier-protein] synthase II